MSTWLDTRPADDVARALADVRASAAQGGRGADMLRYAGGDERFALWLHLTDRRVTRMVGVGLFDLADCGTRDMYDGGLSPREAAREALESDDTFADMFGGE